MTLEVANVGFSYGKRRVLRDISLKVPDGEVYTILGGSGSGKTTLMNIIAGFLDCHQGKVLLGGRDISRLPPENRGVGMVFQEYALFPHLTVTGNISFPLKVKGLKRSDIERKVNSMIGRMGLSGLEKNKPSELSGGERQRVALARMLSSDPEFLLLDEPLSALDASLRDDLRRDLGSILKESAIPALYVTHDQVEAMAISDRIGFLVDGRILEESTPDELYWNPRNARTAAFMGMHNIFRVQSKENGMIRTEVGLIPWKGDTPDLIAFRPDSSLPFGEGLKIPGTVISREYRGMDQLVDLNTARCRVRVILPPDIEIRKGQRIISVIPHERIIGLFDDRIR